MPDESTFCLSCGTRLAPPERLVPVNGGGSAPGAAPRVVEGAAPAGPAREPEASPGPGGRQAYALSFRPIMDERLRYRIARWVCERAPAHTLTEVQEGLVNGDFLTFLALTPEEAEAARQGILGLGVAPALLSLAPVTGTEALISERRAPRGSKGARGLKGKDWVTALAALGALFIFGLVMMRLYGGRGF